MARRGPEQPTTIAQARAVLRALGVTAGRAAYQRGILIAAALFVVALIATRDGVIALTRDAALPLRMLVWAGWLCAMLQASRAVYRTRSSFWIRAQPVHKWVSIAVSGFLLVLVEVPWGLFWTWGAGIVAGATALFAAMSMHAALVTLRRPLWVTLAALGVAALVCTAHGASWGLAVAMASCPPLTVQAWQRAPEAGPEPASHLVFGPPLVALAAAHWAILVRRERSLLLRVSLLTLAAGGLPAVALRNDDYAPGFGLLAPLIAVAAPSLFLGGLAIARRMLSSETELRWVAQMCRTAPATLRLATLVAASAVGAGAGGIAGAMTSLAVVEQGGHAASALATGVVAGTGGAAVALACARWAARDAAKESQRTLIAAVAISVALGLLALRPLLALIALPMTVAAVAVAERKGLS